MLEVFHANQEPGTQVVGVEQPFDVPLIDQVRLAAYTGFRHNTATPRGDDERDGEEFRRAVAVVA
jgi:hypothetical protein